MRLKRYYNTLKYLKPIQIFGRVWFKLKTTKPNYNSAPSLRQKSAPWIQSISKKSTMLEASTFIFLNETHQLTFPQSWNDPKLKKLWLYNLHYFDDLNAQQSQSRKSNHLNLIQQWISGNPPAKGNGWEPYTLSLRIVNWIKWALGGQSLSAAALNSLAQQVRFLNKHYDYHILGNHLLANAKAFIFAGLFFSGAEAEAWLKAGIKILSQQLHEQVLNDGGHFERSPMYHAIILEDVLDLINLGQTYHFNFACPLITTATSMLTWLNSMTHPDGEIVLFNDAAFNIAPKFSELLSYAKDLKLTLPNFDSNKNRFLKATGYAHLTKNNAHLFIDAAPLGPDYLSSHGHADTLSFEFSLGTQRIIVDSGTSLYDNNAERLQQRSTHAHNTVILDQLNSSNVWASFRVAERAKIMNVQFEETDNASTLSACHDGYKNLPGNPLHKRTFILKNSELIIQDEILGKGLHDIELLFHFHPELEIKLDKNIITCNKDSKSIRLELDSSLAINIKDSFYYPEFGKKIQNKKVSGKKSSTLPLVFKSKLTWHGSL